MDRSPKAWIREVARRVGSRTALPTHLRHLARPAAAAPHSRRGGPQSDVAVRRGTFQPVTVTVGGWGRAGGGR